MNVSVEKLEGHMAKLTIEIEPDIFEKAVEKVFQRRKGRLTVPGFRKGKAPRVLVEKMYGPEIFYEEAADEVIRTEYPKAYDECEEDIVSQPEVNIIKMGKGETFVFEAIVATRPDVELGKYKGVTVSKHSTTVTAKEVDESIKRSLRRNARKVEITDRPVEDGDIANIDYEGKVDGVPFDGGRDKGYDLVIGSKSFIEGFEEQVIGHSVGEEFDIDVTFPKKYHAKELAGKSAVFTIKLNAIHSEVVPELTDEYVQDSTEFETVKEYKDSVKKQIKEQKERTAKREKQEEAIQKVVADSTMEIPSIMIESQVESMMGDYMRNLQRQGMSPQQYFTMTGVSADQMREQLRPDAERQIRASLVLEAIAKAENIEVSEEDIEKKVEETAGLYMLDPKEVMKNLSDDDRDQMKKEIAVEKAAELVGDSSKEEKAKKKEDEEESKESTDTKETKESKGTKTTKTTKAKKDSKEGEE